MALQHPSSDREFQSILQGAGDKLVVVDFYADWCGPCRMVAPHFESLAAEFADRAVFCKVNVDQLQQTTAWAGVSAMPTFIAYRGANKLDSVRGADVGGLRRLVEKHAHAPAHAEAHISEGSSVREIKAALTKHRIDTSACIEKSDLVALARRHGLLRD